MGLIDGVHLKRLAGMKVWDVRDAVARLNHCSELHFVSRLPEPACPRGFLAYSGHFYYMFYNLLFKPGRSVL